ncbi:MAG: FtsQ-type POTRA domain-containing protein [Candidatus Rokuibacteriota bacterium]
MSKAGLISPRARAAALHDLGEHSPLVARQRVNAARRRRSRLGRLARAGGAVLLALLAIAAVAAAHAWVTTSPRFAIAAVDVRGASRLPVDRILAVAGIAPGANLWSVDTNQVRGRLEGMSGIRRADVVRTLPNRLTILVEERRPFTLVHAGRLHWLDEDGHVLGEETRAVAPEVPIISGLTEDELTTMRTAPTAKARAAIGIIRALLRSGSALAAEISEIDMGRVEGPVLYTVDGVEVRLGADDWDERLVRLEGVLGQVATQDVRYVDLRFRDQVILRTGQPR